MLILRKKLFLTCVYFLVFHVEFSGSFIFEIAKLIPNIEFKPVVLYKVRDRTVVPTTQNIVEANGYPSETHWIETEDGYILEVHRIPHGIRSPPGPGKMPVILQHGNFQSSADWVLNSPANYSLGFLLADNGYDVWMGNQRGNTYSNRHVKYPLSSHDFWNFRTAESPLRLILSGDNGSKIGLGVTMGPSAFQENFFNGAAKFVAFTSKFGDILLTAFGAFPILPHFLASFLHMVLPLFCNPKIDLLGICINFTHLGFGNDADVITKEQLPLITSVAPSASGYKTANHIVQLIGSGRFAEYDYGRDTNLKIYGKQAPPDYNLTNVRAPISIIVGPNDFLAHRQDAKELAKRLPNLVDFYYVPYKHFTHLDFSYGRDKALLVYDHVLRLFNVFAA